jgi:hypothetical protein
MGGWLEAGGEAFHFGHVVVSHLVAELAERPWRLFPPGLRQAPKLEPTPDDAQPAQPVTLWSARPDCREGGTSGLEPRWNRADGGTRRS